MSEMIDRILDVALARGLNADEDDIRTLIRAMRELTEEMTERGINELDDGMDDHMMITLCWHAMIDEVLR
jgi:hypothetical protein